MNEGIFDALPVDAESGMPIGRKVAIVIQTTGDPTHSIWFSEKIVAPALRRLADDIEKRLQGIAKYEEVGMFIDEEYEGSGDQMILVRMQALDGFLSEESGDEEIEQAEGVDAAVMATLTPEERSAIAN